MSDLVIRNGYVVGPAATIHADVLVHDQTIAAVGDVSVTGAAREIDASGAYVLPGGIDPHVHLQTSQGDTSTSDDFTTGTAAAAFGGTTTVLHFCVQEPGERFKDAIDRWHGMLAAAPPLVDVGFHLLITDLAAGGLDQLAAMPEAGVSSFKVFMAGPPAIPAGDLFRVMQVAHGCGARVMVHAEDGDAIDVLVEQALELDHVAPSWHARTRPGALETAAALRAIEFARVTGAPLYIVHVTVGDTVAAIARARSDGLDVIGETCTQYLVLGPDCLEDGDSARMIFTPPPRAADERDALWAGLASGHLSIVASDHNAFLLRDKRAARDFTTVPQGIPGVESRMTVLHQVGVREGRLSLERFVELTAVQPARAFGLWPRKGIIAPGSVADIVVFDPERRQRLTAVDQHTASDYSAYEDLEVTGSPRTVIVGGQVVVQDGALVAPPGVGSFIPTAAGGTRR